MDSNDNRRELALKRLAAKRAFTTHLAVYLMVNALLVAIWAVQGADAFFPFWTIAGWGIGVTLHAWNTFARRPFNEADIQREMDLTA
jgi:hypothetical protein